MPKNPTPERAHTVVFDIDHTLAEGVVQAHMTIYNELLELGMTAEEIAEAGGRYGKTFDVPQIIKARSEDEPRFQEARAEVRNSPEMHLALTELPFSSDQVRALLDNRECIQGGYYTVRPTEVEEATKQWLKNKDFPDSERVLICKDPKDKLEKILVDHVPDGDGEASVILIDDSLPDLEVAARELVAERPELRGKFAQLVVVGFGHEREGSIDFVSGLRTFTLPSWESEHVERLRSDLTVIAP